MLPERYAWLAREPGPKMIVEALKLFGTLEAAGSANNPTIVAWAKEVGGEVADAYKADSIPWCGLFVAVVAKRAGKELPQHPLWALSWSAFGAKTPAPSLGDVLVFARNGAATSACMSARMPARSTCSAATNPTVCASPASQKPASTRHDGRSTACNPPTYGRSISRRLARSR